jgi:hypothetical protein
MKTRLSLSLSPPNSAHPLRPFLNIISGTNTLNGVPMLRQFLIGGYPVHETMASPAQPCYTIKQLLIMPATLQHFRVDPTRDEVVVGQWYPVTFTDFAGICPSRDPRRWRFCHCGNVSGEDGGHEGLDVGSWWCHERVCGQGIDHCLRDPTGQVFNR